MPQEPSEETLREDDSAAAEREQYYRHLEERGVLAEVDEDTDLSSLPSTVTHVRHPDGRVERLGYSSTTLPRRQPRVTTAPGAAYVHLRIHGAAVIRKPTVRPVRRRKPGVDGGCTSVPMDEYTLDETRGAGAVAGVVPEAGDADAPPMTVQLPDLRAWQSPSDKARILLESAAEIEHALMVQYLYAAYSLKSRREGTDPGQRTVLDEEPDDPADFDHSWPLVIKEVAREEMGHLMTVQNLLLALGLPPNLEREDFPPRKDLYPFALHLEPLTQRSLAKYVVAEAPSDATGIDDIVELAESSGKPRINHVGVLYGLLGLVFATAEQVEAGRTSGGPWDEMVGQLADAAYQQAPPEQWHLPDSAFETARFRPAGGAVRLAGERRAGPPGYRPGHRARCHPGHRRAGRGPDDLGRRTTSSGSGTSTAGTMRFRAFLLQASGRRRGRCRPTRRPAAAPTLGMRADGSSSPTSATAC